MNETARTPSLPATYALLAALALALFVPGLGSYGFWDPYEIRIADAARAHANGAPLAQAATQLGRPAIAVALAASGFRAVGTGEFGGRLPIALVALLAVLACFYAGGGLIRRRGALLGSFILATTPAFLLGARQLTTNAPLILATALAVGGLARALWPLAGASSSRPIGDAIIASVGLVLGQLSAGLLVGIVAPLAAVAAALVLGAPGARRRVGYALAVVALALFAWDGLAWAHPAGYSALLGGTPHPFLSTVVFTNPLKQLGFGLFPWIALLPMAGIHALQSTTTDAEPGERDQFGRLVLVAWFVMLYIAATLQAAGAQELLVPAAPAALLLVGAWLDDLLDVPDAQPFAALTAALGAIIIGRDFFVFPEQYVGVHMLETIRWPGPLTAIPYVIVGFACFFAGVIGLAIGVPLARASSPVEARLRGRFILVAGALGASLVLALGTAHYIVPHVSKHLSSRDLYGKTKALDPNAPLGQYRFNATGSAYYSNGKAPTNLPTLDDLFRFLGKPERVFVMAGVDELPSIRSARQAEVARLLRRRRLELALSDAVESSRPERARSQPAQALRVRQGTDAGPSCQHRLRSQDRAHRLGRARRRREGPRHQVPALFQGARAHHRQLQSLRAYRRRRHAHQRRSRAARGPFRDELLGARLLHHRRAHDSSRPRHRELRLLQHLHRPLSRRRAHEGASGSQRRG